MNLQLIAYPQGTTEPLSYPTGEVVLDLYKDEPIPLVLNVDDFTNVAEKASSYSKTFEIPGTKNNNLFFNHIYDITSDSNFNPHLKTKIVVKEDSIDIFSGYLQLNDIINKGEEISYEITLFSEATNLKDTLGERVFRDLDFSELNHHYDKYNVEDSSILGTGITLLNTLPADSFAGTGTTTEVVKYPLVRWNTSSYGHPSANTIIAPKIWDFYRPFLNCKYILDNIFRDAEYSYQSSFLNSTSFNRLYNDVNTETGDEEVEIFLSDVNTSAIYNTSWTNVDFNTASASSNYIASDYYDISTDEMDNLNGNQWQGVNPNPGLEIIIPSGTRVIELRYKRTATTGSITYWYAGTSTKSSGDFMYNLGTTYYNTGGLPGDKIEMQIRCTSGTFTLGSLSSGYYKMSTDLIDFNNILALNSKGDVNQWEYFKDFIDMFNLLIMVDDNNPKLLNIIPYKDWVDTGNLLDWTDKIDDTEIKHTPIDGLARYVKFKHTEDADDWITFNHNHPNNWKYLYEYYGNIEIYDADENIIELKNLASTYCKFMFSNTDIFAPQIINNDMTENWENKLRVLYDNGEQNVSSGYIYTQAPFNFFYKYSLFTAADTYPVNSNTSSYDFGVVNYQGTGGAVLNSLYNVYWSKYIDELYHKDTRIVELKVYLTSKDLSEFKFNDVILIKNKKFRVKKIEYKSGAMSKVELITIKDL